VTVRDLRWDGCLNVRDLGGHRTRTGAETAFKAVVRADSVRQLTDAGWGALVDYGTRTIVDLRGDDELREDPPIAEGLEVDVVHVPFMEASEQELAQITTEVDEAAAAAPDVATATRDVYLIFLEHFRANVAMALRAVAHARPGVVVVHCAGGKDRTGLLAAFLLYLAGVRVDDIAADYAISEQRLRPRHDAWLAAAETEAERERLKRITATPAAAIVGVFETLESRYGSVEAFLRGAGATTAELNRLRERLLGKPTMAVA
jgi:protein-tyrosine phosphatase